jgi:hypothetical protein
VGGLLFFASSAQVWDDYVSLDSVSSFYFRIRPDGHSVKVFKRHPINDRSQMQVIREYVTKIQESGFLRAVASPPLAVPDVMDRSCWTLELIASASRIEAAYIAAEEQPLNP